MNLLRATSAAHDSHPHLPALSRAGARLASPSPLGRRLRRPYWSPSSPKPINTCRRTPLRRDLMPDTSLAYESPTGVRCARCRAIIESLPDDADCTNCGLGVGLAKAGLLHADPLWLRPVRRGLHL